MYLKFRRLLDRFYLKYKMRRLAKEHKRLADKCDRLLSGGELSAHHAYLSRASEIREEVKALLCQSMTDNN